MIDRAELQRLMTAAADGDRAALDPLFTALWPPVAGYARRFLADATLAEDVAQDALVKLFARLEQYDRERDALTWALTFATWECRTARRRLARRAETPETPPPPFIDGALVAEERELVRAALDTLDTLPARDREVIAALLSDDDELRRSLAPATFRKRLERALGRLRTSWRSRHGTL